MPGSRAVRLALSCSFLFAVPALHAQATQASKAADPRSTLLVSTAWLAQHLKDPDLVLLHVGDKEEYDDKHIPGARFASTRQLTIEDSVNNRTYEMPSPDSLRARLARLGISDNSKIVVAMAGGWFSPATRVLFTLDYAGLGANAVFLDGGTSAWAREGRPLTADVPAKKEGRLSALKIKPIVVTYDFVNAHIAKPGVSIVDGRNTGFYDGVQQGGMGPNRQRAGHIASAKSVPFNEVAGTNDFLKPASDLAALFAKAGVAAGDTIIGYCHIGQQATAMLFAARTLGYPVLLYDGSYDEWSRKTELPVENPSAKK